MKLIDKNALVAEIEKLKDDAHNGVSYHQSRQNIGLENELSTWGHLESAFATVLKIINTLEVKEVDLEKEFDNYTKNILACDVQYEPFTHLYNCAKHFFELGLKARKGSEL